MSGHSPLHAGFETKSKWHFPAHRRGSRANSLEALEARIAPALLIAPGLKSATYTDADGDLVTVAVTKGNLKASDFTLVAAGAGEQLQLLDLHTDMVNGAPEFAGTSVTITARPGAAGGDGFAAIGRIDARGVDLAAVSIKGDLGVLDAGSGAAGHTAVASLTVASLGAYGLSTGAPDLVSNLTGKVGPVTVKSEVRDAELEITGALTSLTVGGSIVGGAIAGGGCVSALSIGPVKIGGDLRGGSAAETGMVESQTTMGTVTIGGSILGGAGGDSGELLALGDLGAVTVKGDLAGGCGTVAFSGVIDSHGKITSVTIGGSVLGGTGPDSGEILSLDGGIGSVKIAHDLRGGSGLPTAAYSGNISSHGPLGAVTIGGSVLGGSNGDSGEIYSTDTAAAITIAGDVRGGAGGSSGIIYVIGPLTRVSIGGSLEGGAGPNSAEIYGGNTVGPVKIGGDLRGGDDYASGYIFAYGTLASVTVGGALAGGSNDFSGYIYARNDLGPVTIGGDMLGGAGNNSGAIYAYGSFFASGTILASVTIGGSLIGGTGNNSGYIFSVDDIGPIKIAGDMVGGSITGAASSDQSGGIETSYGRIASVAIGGSIRTGQDTSSGALTKNGYIGVGYDLGSLTVGGSLVGNATNPVTVFGSGELAPPAKSNRALGSITIGGRVEYAQLLGGYDLNPGVPQVTYPDGQIGAVKVGGDWIASRLAAGTNVGADGVAGTDDDTLAGGGVAGVKSAIASISIGGQVRGTFAGSDSFRFMAESIGVIKVGGTAIPLVATERSPLGITGDVHIVTSASTTTPGAEVLAPLKLKSATSATYTDADGDLVTVTFTAPILTSGNLASVLTVSGGLLQKIDVTGVAAGASGTGITVAVERAGHGDGYASVGYINATNLALGAVKVRGDLGALDAGTGTAGSVAVKSLSVASVGGFGLATGATDLASTFNGSAGPLTVATDVRGAQFQIGALTSLTVGGSLIGGSGPSAGRFSAASIGSIKVGGDLAGASGNLSGEIETAGGGNIGRVTIGGSILGGGGAFSGELYSDGTLGAVKIGGSVLGGAGLSESGIISAKGNVLSVAVGGSVVGGVGPESGEIVSEGASLGPVTIAHDLRGGPGLAGTDISGVVRGAGAATAVTSVSIGGSLIGGSSQHAGGAFSTSTLGPVKIAHDLRGGSGDTSGTVLATETIASVTIGGSLIGGAGAAGGQLNAKGLGPVKITGDLIGGSAAGAGFIQASAGMLPSVVIGGSLRGGSVGSTGNILSFGDVSDQTKHGVLGKVKIGGDIAGGAGSDSATIFGQRGIVSLTVGGSLRGGGSDHSGRISGGLGLLSVNIAGSVIGGGGTFSGSIDSTGVVVGSNLFGGSITQLTIGGSLRSAAGDGSGSITASVGIGTLAITGDIVGNATQAALISIRGFDAPAGKTDVLLKTLKVGGTVEFARILAGIDFNLQSTDGHAQIGAVTVGRDWIASSLVAGIKNLGADDAAGGSGANADNVNFGDAHDVPIATTGIVASIASITIGGQVRGSVGGLDVFGFDARAVGPVKVGGTSIALPAGANAVALGDTGDVRIHDFQ